jgi:hypothetical protein
MPLLLASRALRLVTARLVTAFNPIVVLVRTEADAILIPTHESPENVVVVVVVVVVADADADADESTQLANAAA